LLAAVLAGVLLSGCTTRHPPPLSASALAEAQTFPYYPIYWVGAVFDGHHLTAVDGRTSYSSSIGESVYYGDCVRGKGFLGGGSCLLPLQVTTVIYRLHSNGALGPQRNTVIRGVPAVIYDGGRSIELYSGRMAIDVFSDAFSRAYGAATRLRPLNAPGSAAAPLPSPVFCPGLSGTSPARVAAVMAALPNRACQRADAATAKLKALRRPPSAG
jgi:hypothetical protein